MMNLHFDTVRDVITGKSPVFGMLFSGSIGLGTAEVLGINVNTIIIVALCGAAGAFFGCLPRLIMAISGADATARGLLGKELALLLDRIHRLEQRVVLEQGAKHIVQSEHNNVVIHAKNLEAALREARGPAAVPAFTFKSYEEMLGPIDRKIQVLMLAEPKEEE